MDISKADTRHTFTLIGNDKRSAFLKDILIKYGFLYSECKNNSNIIILPLPYSRDKIHVNTNDKELTVDNVIKKASENSIIFGGLFDEEFINKCNAHNIKAYDYYKNEEMIKKNAYATAEGSVMLAMQNTNVTVKDTNYTIFGYGRIGKMLCDILSSMGAYIHVCARGDKALQEAKEKGFDTFKLTCKNSELADILDKSTVIINTIPAKIINESIIKSMKNKPLYIELASKSGIDTECAKACGMQYINAPSLPSLYSPYSAAIYIFEEITNILKDRRDKI